MSLDIEKMTFELKVNKRISETADTVSLIFDIPNDLKKQFQFTPAQFLTLFLPIDGQYLPRSYSISSAPPMEPELKVTIKRVSGGRGSNYILDHIKEGDKVRVSPPAGAFFKPLPDSCKHVLLFAAGSGITPIFSIFKTALLTMPQTKVTLVFSNRFEDQIIYGREIESWQQRFASRAKVIHVISQPKPTWAGYRGRCDDINTPKLLNSLETLGPETQVYLCGPVAFMDNIRVHCLSRGVPATHVHSESFITTHSVAPESTGDDGRIYIGDTQVSPVGAQADLEIRLGREVFKAKINKDQTVIEALIEAGANPPYSCLEGNCMACIGKVIKGRVYQPDPGILSDDNFANRETLTCQSRPASAHILIDYDAI